MKNENQVSPEMEQLQYQMEHPELQTDDRLYYNEDAIMDFRKQFELVYNEMSDIDRILYSQIECFLVETLDNLVSKIEVKYNIKINQ